MKELKAKAKVTQAMTRDGLTLENQATGEVENISNREAEADFTPEAGGTADKLLERADAAHDRHRAKKTAKQAGATAAETAMIGDKLLTDMLGANLSGVTALMVEPAGGARTPWQKVLHALQAPWKHLAGGIHRI